MTGSPDDCPDEGGPDRLPRPPVEYLSPPPGSFDRIRRRAARRRRARALLGGTAAAAVITGSLYLVGNLSGRDDNAVVTPPATSGRDAVTTAAPPPATTPPSRAASPLPPPAGHRTPGTTDSGPTTAKSETSPSPGASETSGSPGAQRVCATSQLTAELGGGDAGAGNLYRYLVLTNSGRTSCRVAGYPGLSLLDAQGRQIGVPATRQTMAYTPVVLAPGESASDTVHTVNHQGTCLPASVSLRIYPPGEKHSLVFAGVLQNCHDTFSVTPFTKGTTGNPAG